MAKIGRLLHQLRQDARGALRQWRKRPLMAAAALLTMALGTGINVAIFGIVWSALLKPLPYPDSARLVQIWGVVTRADGGLSAADRRLPNGSAVELWRARNSSFRMIATYRPWRVTVAGTGAGGGDPERVSAGSVSAEFLPALGATTVLGRLFSPGEVRPGSDDVVVLGYGYWTSRFAADRGLLGRDIVVDGKRARVIGVLAPGVRDLVTYGAREPSLYVPISRLAEGPLKVSSGFVIGKLKDGVGIEAARSELETLSRQVPVSPEKDSQPQGVRIVRLDQEIGYSVRPALLAMFAAAGCLLLIACVNVANLLLAQAIGRRQELAIRAAVGASRQRLVRQLLTEALLLSFGGMVVGLGAAWLLSRCMVALYPGTLPRLAEGGASGVVLLFAALLAMLTAIFFGVAPAFLATRGTGDVALRAGRTGALPAAGRLREALVGIQVAATAALLIGAGLLAKSFVSLRAVDPGFEQDHVFTAQVALPDRYHSDDDRTRFAHALVESFRTIPGARGAAVTNTLPLSFNVLAEIQFDIARGEEHRAQARAVMGDYFDVLGLRVKEGRPLTAADDGHRDIVAVNESFVRAYLDRVPPVGAVLRFGPSPATVVGVVRDLHTLGLRRPVRPEIYVTFASLPSPLLDVVVRSSVPPGEIASAARARLRELDPELALAQVSSMDRIVDREFAQPRFQTAVLGLFAAVAMVLAAVGIYGVIAQGVRARTQEFGVRVALGATASGVFWMVVRQGLRAPLIGLAAGLVAAFLTGRVLESMLFGITPRDPLVFSASAALLALVCVASCALPAGQASRADPARALRDE